MKRSQFWLGIAALLGMGILILDSKTALTGAREAVQLCIQSLIPSLFPFFVLSSLLTNAFLGASPSLLRPVGRLLQIPQGCEAILIPAFLGGYPAGAQCIGQAYNQGNISKASARRLLLFCNNAGPSFLFGVLGPIFPQQWMLWVLWALQIAGALLCAWIFPGDQDKGCVPAKTKVSLTECLSASVRVMGSVCGWVVLFRVLIAFGKRWVLWILPSNMQVAIMGLLELSNGCYALLSVPDVRMRFLICAGILSFGGICVAMQTSSVIGPLPVLPYLGSKLLQCLFSLSISAAFLYRIPMLFAFTALVCWVLKKIVAMRDSMVYNGDINLRRNPYAFSKKNGARLRLLSSRHSAGG